LAAFENQLGLSTQQESAQLHHPPCGWQADAGAPRPPEDAEKLPVR
jgi:hypothetical protein